MRRLLFVSLAFAGAAFAQTITINSGVQLQTIDGFGAATGSLPVIIPGYMNDMLWTNSGIGLSIHRTEIVPDYADCVAWRPGIPCVTVPSGSATLLEADLANMQAAYTRGTTRILASASFPPTSMMTNCDGGPVTAGNPGCFLGNSTNYAALAAIQASFVTLITGSYGIPIYALSVQNEPDTYAGASCIWTAQQIHDYVPYLHAALILAGYPGVKIMISEQSRWDTAVAAMTPSMNDATVAAQVGVLAAHYYAGSASQMTIADFSNVTTQHLWETEVSDFATYDPTMTSALTYATDIHNLLTVSNISAFLYFYASYCDGCANDNEALTSSATNSTMAKRGYALGNWAKFVKPGCNRVSVTNSTSLLVTAFSCASSAVIVAINNSGSDATGQVFSGIPGTQVTPWITSGAYDLQSQAATALSGGTVSYTLPAYSVVTLVSPYLNSRGSTLEGGISGSGGIRIR